MNARINTFYHLNSQLSLIGEEQLNSLLPETAGTRSWSNNYTITLGQSKIFIKRIPVTALEYDRMFSTKNHFHLPTYYNYGIWSAGFGAFRELITHIKTTNWVLNGAIENFPLLYHYRLRPFTGQRPEVNLEEHQKYVTYWNSNHDINHFILTRARAEYEAVLFLEHLPVTLEMWLGHNIDKLASIIIEMQDTITFLRNQGMVHFDLHLDNILIEEGKPYLTDFGLMLDSQFDLSQTERAFLAHHSHYDYGQFLYDLGWYIITIFQSLTEPQQNEIRLKYGLQSGTSYRKMLTLLLDNIEAIYASNLAPLDKDYVDMVVKYRPIMMLMHAFSTGMRSTNAKDVEFDSAQLKRLLKETDFVATVTN